MKLIVACDPNGGIGYNNKLPWSKIEGDLPRFKQLTTGQKILMGYNTYESLPVKPLPNRTNYVISRTAIPGVITLASEKLIKSVLLNEGWIIGGSKTIQRSWDLIDEIHLTRTMTEYTCDTFIDLIKLENEFCLDVSEQHADHIYEIWKRK